MSWIRTSFWIAGLSALIFLQAPMNPPANARLAGGLAAQSRPPSIASLAAGARKISVKVPDGHLMGASTTSRYTHAMSDGAPAPKLVIGPDGELYLGYNDAQSNARVALLRKDLRLKRMLVQLQGKRLEDLAADDDGVALLLTEFDSKRKNNYVQRNHHTAHIEKYDSRNGRAIFRTRIVGAREYTKEGDQGVDTTFGTFSIAYDGDDSYATYFSTYRRWDDGITHQSEYLALFDADDGERRMRDDGRKSPQGFTWNVSHSFRPRFVHDGERFVMATVGDAYPRGFVVQFFPEGERELPVKVPKAKPGETYQYVPLSTGDLYARDETSWIVFDSAVGRSTYDIGLIRVDEAKPSKPVFITNTNRSRERIPRLAPYGRDHLLVLWMKDAGPAKSKWHPAMKTMSLEGAMVDSRGRVVSKAATFGAKGQFALRSAARMFQLPDGRVGWVNDVTGIADQLELVVLPGPNGGADEGDDSDDKPEPPPEQEETVKINPKLNRPLLIAIYDGDEPAALKLLKRGADPNAKSGQWSALLYAAYFGRAVVVNDLIRRKADPNAVVSGWTALRLAESRGHDAIAKALRPITRVQSRAFGLEARPQNPGGPTVRTRGAHVPSPGLTPGTNPRGQLRKLGQPKQ